MGNIEESLKDRVKRLRDEAGLSQLELSNLASISEQTVKDIESGRTDGGQKSMFGLAKAFGISVEQLLGREAVKTERQIKFKASKLTRYLEAIPDEVYDLAIRVGRDSPIWDLIIEELKKEAASESAKKA